VHLVGFHYKKKLFGSRYLRTQLSQLFPDKFFVSISYISQLNSMFDRPNALYIIKPTTLTDLQK